MPSGVYLHSSRGSLLSADLWPVLWVAEPARLMRKNDVRAKAGRKLRPQTTDSAHSNPVAPWSRWRHSSIGYRSLETFEQAQIDQNIAAEGLNGNGGRPLVCCLARIDFENI